MNCQRLFRGILLYGRLDAGSRAVCLIYWTRCFETYIIFFNISYHLILSDYLLL